MNTMSRRDVWLTVALAVAKGQIAQPTDFEVRDDIKMIELVYNARVDDPLAVAHAGETAAFFGLGDAATVQPGIRVWWENKDGWSWNVRAYFHRDDEQAAADPALAEQVLEAIGAGV